MATSVGAGVHVSADRDLRGASPPGVTAMPPRAGGYPDERRRDTRRSAYPIPPNGGLRPGATPPTIGVGMPSALGTAPGAGMTAQERQRGSWHTGQPPGSAIGGRAIRERGRSLRPQPYGRQALAWPADRSPRCATTAGSATVVIRRWRRVSMGPTRGGHRGEARWPRWLAWLIHQPPRPKQRNGGGSSPAPRPALGSGRVARNADDLLQDWRAAGFNEQEWHRLRFLRWCHRRGDLTEFPQHQ